MSILPDWNSIESTAWWSDFLFWAGIGCLVLLAVTEVASHIYGSRSSELAEYKQAAQQAHHNADAAAMSGQLAEAEKKVQELQRLQTARQLTDEQKTKLLAYLAGKPTGFLGIFVVASAADASSYGEAIASTLMSAGWRTQIDNGIMFGGGDITGMWLRISSNENIPPEAPILFEAFRAAGIEIKPTVFVDRSVHAGIVQLVIGPRF